MHKNKNRGPKTLIAFYNCNNELLFKGELDSIPIKETVIIQKSIEFYNDHNPCYIHRGAVIVRLLGEIENYMKMRQEGTFIIGKNMESVVDYIDIDGIHSMEMSLL